MTALLFMALVFAGITAACLFGAAIGFIGWLIGFFGHNEYMRGYGSVAELFAEMALYSFIAATAFWILYT